MSKGRQGGLAEVGGSTVLRRCRPLSLFLLLFSEGGLGTMPKAKRPTVDIVEKAMADLEGRKLVVDPGPGR